MVIQFNRAWKIKMLKLKRNPTAIVASVEGALTTGHRASTSHLRRPRPQSSLAFSFGRNLLTCFSSRSLSVSSPYLPGFFCPTGAKYGGEALLNNDRWDVVEQGPILAMTRPFVRTSLAGCCTRALAAAMCPQTIVRVSLDKDVLLGVHHNGVESFPTTTLTGPSSWHLAGDFE